MASSPVDLLPRPISASEKCPGAQPHQYDRIRLDRLVLSCMNPPTDHDLPSAGWLSCTNRWRGCAHIFVFVRMLMSTAQRSDFKKHRAMLRNLMWQYFKHLDEEHDKLDPPAQQIVEWLIASRCFWLQQCQQPGRDGMNWVDAPHGELSLAAVFRLVFSLTRRTCSTAPRTFEKALGLFDDVLLTGRELALRHGSLQPNKYDPESYLYGYLNYNHQLKRTMAFSAEYEHFPHAEHQEEAERHAPHQYQDMTPMPRSDNANAHRNQRVPNRLQHSQRQLQGFGPAILNGSQGQPPTRSNMATRGLLSFPTQNAHNATVPSSLPESSRRPPMPSSSSASPPFPAQLARSCTGNYAPYTSSPQQLPWVDTPPYTPQMSPNVPHAMLGPIPPSPMYTPPATAPMRHATPVSTNVYLPSYTSGWWSSGGQKRFYYEDAQGGLYDIRGSTRN